jgi:AcrR family transcriptional regulator
MPSESKEPSSKKNPIGKKARRTVGRPRREDRVSRDETRDLMLKAAIKLFARHGYEPVTTAEIAAQAGVTQSVVHYHFGSKLNLWREAIKRMMKERGRLFRSAARELNGLTPLDRLKELTRRLIEANAANPDFVRIAVHEGTQRGPRLNWLVENYFAAGFGVFDEAVREAIDAGDIPNMPIHDVTNAITSAASLTFGLTAMIEQIYSFSPRSSERVHSFSENLIGILFAGLLARPANQ